VDVLGSIPDLAGKTETVELIGASMGGSVAVELARRCPDRIGRLLLLAPAGLTGRSMPLPRGLDQLGVWFLSRPGVRRGRCRQAFAEPGPSLASFARSGGFAGAAVSPFRYSP